jgi:hypothetical protein
VQFDPVGTAQFRSACDIAKSLLAARGVSYKSTTSGDGSTKVIVGGRVVPIEGGETFDAAGLKIHKAEMGERIGASLAAAGYPKAADPRAVDLPLLMAVLLGFVVAATALYGPQASALVEMFPTRVRYTALSLPYHVGTGWVGGFLPVTGVALVAISGDIYAGLWYPVVFTAISAICTLLFLKETKGKPLEEV